MNTKRTIKLLLIVAIIVANIGCDQASKKIVRQKISSGEQINVINNFLTLSKVENKGAFLSAGNSLPQPLRTLLLTILPLAILGAAFIYLLTKKGLSYTNLTGICFIIGGGIGNIYDRMMYGSVTDFLHLDFALFQTGIFNMADVSVMAGMGMVLFEAYFKRHKTVNH